MSAGEAERQEIVPEVPSVWRLAWLLFMQPTRLRPMFEAWGLGKQSIGSLPRRLRAREGKTREVLGRCAIMLFVLMPIAAVLAGAVLSLVTTVDWAGVALGVASGMVFGAAGGVAGGMAVGTAYGVAVGVAVGVAGGMAGSIGGVAGALGGTVGAMAIGTAYGMAGVVVGGMLVGVAVHVVGGMLVGMLVGVWASGFHGVAVGVVASVAYGVAFFRIPFFVLASLFTTLAVPFARRPSSAKQIAKWLPYLHHDLIYLPLPRLPRLLIELATHDPAHTRELIDKAAATQAQGKPAQRALHELQARALERLAKRYDWPAVIELRDPFFPQLTDLPADDPLRSFVNAARNLLAARDQTSQSQRRHLLDAAARDIESMKTIMVSVGVTTTRARRLLGVADQWTAIIDTRRSLLAEEIAQNPDIPAVFVAGQPLDPSDPIQLEVFRKRRYVIRILEQDLDSQQRGTLYLSGQRRMGKSTLLRLLPRQLGAATTVAICNFQRLSGQPWARTPHRGVIESVTTALAPVAGLEVPPTEEIGDAWGSALDWLEALDGRLARVEHRLLIAIDEIEALEKGRKDGWCDLAFLDFARAAGDSLTRTRLLLVGAHFLSSSALGPEWPDRLISVLPRRLGLLDAKEAEALLRRPVKEFPASVFGDEVAATILAETGTHPYLIQLVGREVVARLRADGRRVAEPDDVDRAFAIAVNEAGAHLFEFLWNTLEPAQRDVMLALARGEAVGADEPIIRGLRAEDFVEFDGDRPVLSFPLFGRWVRSSGSLD